MIQNTEQTQPVMSAEILKERQGWTLEQKIDHSLGAIDAFVSRSGGLDNVYVAFSGGKDSTVLLHLCRRLYPDILGVFCNTGNENPDIIKHVKKLREEGANIEIIRPAMTPRQVWAKYGFPLVSKETAQMVHEVRTNPNSAPSIKHKSDRMFSLAKRWRYLTETPYASSHQCCGILKKTPFKRYEKQTGRLPIIGTMADESRLRREQYIRRGGCNVFKSADDKKQRAASLPLSVWTEEDIWAYIKKYDIPLAEVYNKGAKRTGCMGCGFGATFKDDTRFDLLYEHYPKCYEMIMNYTNNGVTFREALRETFKPNGKTLPDERPNPEPTLFD